MLAATLPVLRSRGLTALPVTYIGKAATFALMSAFPLILLGQWDALWSRVILACGWAFLIWGLALYLWSAVLYLIQVGDGDAADAEGALAGVTRRTTRGARWLRPRRRTQRARGGRADADPGAVAAAIAAVRPPRPRLRGGGRAAQRTARSPAAGWPPRAGRCWPRWLIATVFAVAVAQAQATAPGVREAQQVLADSVRSAEDGHGRRRPRRRDALAAEVDAERRSRLEGDERAGSCSAASTAPSFSAAATAVIGPGLTVTVTDPGVVEATSATCPRSASRAAGR